MRGGRARTASTSASAAPCRPAGRAQRRRDLAARDAAIRWTVADPVALTEGHEDPFAVVYLAGAGRPARRAVGAGRRGAGPCRSRGGHRPARRGGSGLPGRRTASRCSSSWARTCCSPLSCARRSPRRSWSGGAGRRSSGRPVPRQPRCGRWPTQRRARRAPRPGPAQAGPGAASGREGRARPALRASFIPVATAAGTVGVCVRSRCAAGPWCRPRTTAPARGRTGGWPSRSRDRSRRRRAPARGRPAGRRSPRCR